MSDLHTKPAPWISNKENTLLNCLRSCLVFVSDLHLMISKEVKVVLEITFDTDFWLAAPMDMLWNF